MSELGRSDFGRLEFLPQQNVRLGREIWSVVSELPSQTTALSLWESWPDRQPWKVLSGRLSSRDKTRVRRMLLYLVRADENSTLAQLSQIDVEELNDEQTSGYRSIGPGGISLFKIGFQGEGIEE